MTSNHQALSAPEWFMRAVQSPKDSRFTDVEGCPIHYLRWGDSSLPGMLFVGASGGHAHWYDHIAPLMTDQFHIAALDLSGCGDSGRRETYSQELVTREIMAVLADSEMLDNAIAPTLVGHSAGAQCAVRTALAHGENLLGLIAADGLRYAELESDHAIAYFRSIDPDAPPPPKRPPKIFESLEDAASRFRLMPAPHFEIENDFIIRHIGWHSYKEIDSGWVTKFDTAQTQVIDLAFELTGTLKDLPCRAASLYGQSSHLTDASAGPAVTAMNDGKVTSFTIPGTSHFPQIDSPFAFISAVKGIALTWLAETRRK